MKKRKLAGALLPFILLGSPALQTAGFTQEAVGKDLRL